jgi:hypothetical protein
MVGRINSAGPPSVLQKLAICLIFIAILPFPEANQATVFHHFRATLPTNQPLGVERPAMALKRSSQPRYFCFMNSWLWVTNTHEGQKPLGRLYSAGSTGRRNTLIS